MGGLAVGLAVGIGMDGGAAPSVAITTLPTVLVVGVPATIAGTSNGPVTVTVNGEAWDVETAPVAGAWSIEYTPTAAMAGDAVDVVASITGASDTQQTDVLQATQVLLEGVDQTTRDDAGTLYLTGWGDQSGGALDAAQATDANQPLENGGAPLFDGAASPNTDYLTCADTWGGVTDAHTLVMDVDVVTWAALLYILDDDGYDISLRMQAGDVLRCRVTNAVNYNEYPCGTGRKKIALRYLATEADNATKARLWIGGVEVAATATGGTIGGSPVAHVAEFWGSDNAGASGSNMRLHSVMHFAAALTPDQCVALTS